MLSWSLLDWKRYGCDHGRTKILLLLNLFFFLVNFFRKERKVKQRRSQHLLASLKKYSPSSVSIGAVYRCLECLPFWCYFRRSAFHSKSYSKDPKIVPAKNVSFSVISHQKRVKLQDFANVQNRKRSSLGWCSSSGHGGSCSGDVWLCSSWWRSRSRRWGIRSRRWCRGPSWLT